MSWRGMATQRRGIVNRDDGRDPGLIRPVAIIVDPIGGISWSGVFHPKGRLEA
jgi:hypothetical protein